MINERFKIVAQMDDKTITLETANNQDEAEEMRVKYATSFSSSWKIKIVRSTEDL